MITILGQFWQDIRYAVRSLRRSPGFAVVSILVIALGIGANTAIFSLFDAVLLRTLPVAEPQQLFLVNEINPREQGPAALSWPGYERLRKGLPDGAQLVALAGPTRFNMASESGGMEPMSGQLVSGNYFTVLGVRAELGRLLNEEDNRTLGSSPVAVLSYSAWSRRFGRDRQVLGRTIKLNGAALTIVGVAEPGFFGVSLGESPDVWLPLMMQHEVRYAHDVASWNGNTTKAWPPQENLYWLRAFVRVRPPATDTTVAEYLNVAFQHEQVVGQQQVGVPRDRRLALEPGARGFTSFRRRLATPLATLMGMVALVLVIACANVANLLLARGTARQKEMAVRLSIGASRMRLLRQLLTESLMLSLIGGGVGLLFVRWAVPVLPRLFSLPVTLSVDYRLVVFAAAVSIATGLLFGSVPALRGTRTTLNTELKAGTGTQVRRSRQAFGKGLVVIQIALSLVLITGAALLSRSMANLLRVDLGFDREHVLTVLIDPQSAGFTPQQLPELYQRLISRIESLPQVQHATISVSSLAGGGQISSGIYIPGYTPLPSERPRTFENFVAPGYFAIMGMRLISGRDFSPHDIASAPRVAIVNEAFVRRYLGGQNPLGRRFGYSAGHSGFEIVGVVADAKTANPRQPASPMVYRPIQQEMQYARSLEVRTEGDPRALASQVRNIISEVEPNLPVIEVTPLAERVDRTLNQDRLLTQLTSSFALFALLLACLGIYGLMSYRVARRTADVGIRMALGAQKRDVIWMVLRESLVLLSAGLAIGTTLALASTRLLQSLLFGLRPTDPLSLLLAVLLMSAIAIISAYVPALRAARVDPAVALRHE